MDYLTVNEIEPKWGISGRRIRILCEEGRISGAIKKGNQWLIPFLAEKPEKLKSGRKPDIAKILEK